MLRNFLLGGASCLCVILAQQAGRYAQSGPRPAEGALDRSAVGGVRGIPDYVAVVSHAGAIGDGRADDTGAIQKAIDDSPEGSVLDFGEDRTYLIRGTLRLLPNRIYRGGSKLVMADDAIPGTPMLRLPYGENRSVTLEGLTFDARQIGGILQIAVGGGTAAPGTGIVVRNCTLRNSGRGGQISESGIYTPVGLDSSVITGNRFFNCMTCIHIVNPNRVAVTDNEFDTTRGGNAISVVAYNFAFPYGQGLEIARNRGRNLKRMAVEIVGGVPGTRMNDALIADNTFTDWQPVLDRDAYGISVATGTKPRILRNTLSGRDAGYGIEVGAPGSVVSGNSVRGFAYGIAIQGQNDVAVSGNQIAEPLDAGILFSNAGANLRAQVTGNTIVNARRFGIGMNPNNYGGSVIEHNTIEREGGHFPEDAAETFMGIKMDAGPSSPVTVSGNRIVQTASTPPPKFTFVGVGFFGGFPGSAYNGNVIESKSAAPMGTGFLFWFKPHANGSSVSDNQLINLARITNGFTSPRVNARNNRAIGVLQSDPHIVSPANVKKR